MPDSLAAALAELQQQLPHVPKTQDAQVGPRTYKYADLADVSAALLPLLGTLGLSFTCCPDVDVNGRFGLRYLLSHLSGDSMGGWYPLPSTGTPQQVGSAITYARRYALCAITGLAPAGDDDDAAAAEKHAQDDAERRADGRMDSAQRAEHAALRDHGPGRPADRGVIPPGDDLWTQPAPGPDEPGTVTPQQLQQVGTLYSRLGLGGADLRDTRLAEMTDRIGRQIGSSKELSFNEAAAAVKALSALVSERTGRA
jgi:hypothetical protein